MRIDAMNKVSQIYQNTGTKKIAKSSNNALSDKLELSPLARDMQVAQAAVKAAPDTRADRVAQLKAQVQNGTYNVSDDDLAKKMAEAFAV